MDTSLILQWISLIFLLICSGFFSSAETAFVTVNHIQVKLLADKEDKKAARVLWILEHTPKMLSAILIGNNLVNISASAIATTLTIRLFGNAYVGAATGILTLLVLLFGEITPKSLATTYSLRLALFYSGIVKALMVVLTPVIWIVEFLRKGILGLLHVDPDEKTDTMTEDELKELVDVGYEEGAIENDEFEMISNVFRLDESLARDIMSPRIDMVYVQADCGQEEFENIYQEYKYTRYPVYQDNRDTVVGVLNVKDLIFSDEEEFDIRRVMREPYFTFAHKEIGTLLLEMRRDSASLAIVLDESGAVIGMITMEDILEEIVGDIRDEYDKDETDAIRSTQPGVYIVDGTTNLDDVNRELELDLVSKEYETIAGYLIEYLDRLPRKGETITLEDGTQITSTVVRKNRIETVCIRLNKEGVSDEEEGKK